ncbi:MAG: response regulator [Acidobacteriota bacterium]
MLVRCPQCRSRIRLTAFGRQKRVVPFLCSRCGEIVRIDLVLDEVRSSSAASSFQRIRKGWVVLVADNSAASCQVAACILGDAGHAAIMARDGYHALEMIRAHHPDVVILGLTLRGLNGFDLLREVHNDDRLRCIPVLIMGRVYKPNVLSYLATLGAVGFIDRERLVETLLFRVERLLAGNRSSSLRSVPGPSSRARAWERLHKSRP